MDVPITIRPEAPTPIYQQLKYQLAHLITSGRLAAGTRLPTVRALADRYDINPGTVAQAYRELGEQGLIEATRGRGTFVAATLPVEVDATSRRRLLDDALRRAVRRARGLGFGDGEVRQQLDLVLAAAGGPTPLVFAAPTMIIARKYATSLERRLAPALEVHPVTFDAIAARSPHVATLLESAYFVATFAGFARAVEHDLARFGPPTRVLGCTTEVQPHTLRALRELAPSTTLCLVTQEPYLPPSLELVVRETGRTVGDVAVCLDGDDATARRWFAAVDRVVYTFAARDFVVEHGVPPERRLEVSFDLTDGSVARVRQLLFPEAAGAESDRPRAAWSGAAAVPT